VLLLLLHVRAQLEPNPYSAFDCQGVKFERNLALELAFYVKNVRLSRRRVAVERWGDGIQMS